MASKIKILIVPTTALIWFFVWLVTYLLEFVSILPQGSSMNVFIFFLIVVIVEIVLLFILPLFLR